MANLVVTRRPWHPKQARPRASCQRIPSPLLIEHWADLILNNSWSITDQLAAPHACAAMGRPRPIGQCSMPGTGGLLPEEVFSWKDFVRCRGRVASFLDWFFSARQNSLCITPDLAARHACFLDSCRSGPGAIACWEGGFAAGKSRVAVAHRPLKFR